MNDVRHAFRVCMRRSCQRSLQQAWSWFLAVTLAILAGPLAAQTTFTNSNTILLPVPPGTGSLSNAVPGEPGSPYPSTINVSGLGTQIGKLTVTINDFRHTGPDDVDMLLVGPQGQKMIIWSDVGLLYSTCSVDFGTLDCNNGTGLGWAGPTVTLDDAALGDLSTFQNSAIVTGTYKPTNVGSANDMFPSPAPIGPYASPRPDGVATFASVFNGANPNGAWSLYVIDDALSFSGRINGGWSLTITTAGTALLATTTTLTGATPNPSNVGQSVTVQYSVTAAAGAPSGFVTVTDGVNSCTATVATGGCVVAFSTPGDRILTATYSGNTVFAPSAATRAQRVRTSTTTAIIADTPDPSSVGQVVSVRYAVTPAAAGGPAPTGTVRVTDGVHACVGTVADGACSIALGTPGVRTLSAAYAGDGYNLTSVSVGTAHQVTQMATTTVIVGVTPEPSVVGQAYTVSYSVAVTPPGTGTPSGSVTVSDGSATCIVTLPATSCMLTGTTPGAKSLTATYNGDTVFSPSTSAAATHQVTKAATATAILADTPDPSVINQAYTVTYSVAVTEPGLGMPTGTVTVSDGAATCTGTLPATSCALTSTTAGAKSLSATYNGDINFSASTAAAATHQVTKAATTTVILSDTPDPSAVNQAYVVTYSVAVTAPGLGTPTGSVKVSDGVATCTGTLPATSCALTSTTAGAKSLTATYSGDTSFSASTSATATHQVTKAATTTAILADTPDPSAVNQAYTVTYSVAVTAPGPGVPTGTVTVSDGVASCTGTLPATSCALISTTAGAKSLTATYNGDINFSASTSAAATHQVTKAATTTAIVSDTPDPSAVGQPYTVTYSVVVATPGAGTPTGTVTVSDGTASCTATLPATSCQLPSNTPGTKSLTATYNGDTSFSGSVSASASHQVTQMSTTIAIVGDTPDPSVVGQPYTVSYSVGVTPPGTGTPSGTVTVSDGSATCIGTLPATNCALTSTTPGVKLLTATYNGDANFGTSTSSAATHQVTKAATTTVIVSDTPDPSAVGQPYTVTYSVTVVAPGGGTPGGTVTVSDGTATCTGTLSTSSCQLPSNTQGTKSLTATYNGDTNFNGSVSASTSHQVNQMATTTAIVGDTPDPSVVGQPYTVSYSVAVTPPGTGTPSGTVTVSDGSATCIGTLPASNCALTSTTPGTKLLTATYNGDANFGASTSAAATHQVTKAATTTVILSDTPDPSAVNQAYVVTYSVAVTEPGLGMPAGTVTVSDGAASCTGTLPATSCTLTSTTAGAKSLSATYNGDINFSASTSAAATHQVSKAATTTAIVSDTPDPSASGQIVVVTFAVTGAGTPTGTVTISDGVVSCSGSVAAGQCALTFATPGEHALSATYSGDDNFTGSLGSALHRVLYNTTTAIVSHSPDPSAPGQGFTVTYAVTPTVTGGPALTGAVTVTDGVNACVGTVAAGSCLLALNTAGTRILTANYAGDGANMSSTSAGILHTVGAPDLTITKTHAGVFSPGQMGATYTITVANAGGAPSAGAVTVADILPVGLIAAGISGAGWNCAKPAGPCSRSDALAANGSYPSLTLVVNVAASVPTNVTNVATVSGGGDTNASNNTASDPTSTAGAVQGILTITKWGSATGRVASADGGIDCGATCQHSYPAGTTITLEATPDAGAVFAGWLGACNGNGSCIVDINGDTSVTANFAQDAIGTISLDIDDDGNYDALTDGILVIRYLLGLTGSTLTGGATAVNANRTDPAQVLNYLDDIEPVLDIDGNGQVDAMTDGLIVLRYLFGMRGAVLVQDAIGTGAMRSTAEMEAYLLSLTP